MNNSLLTSLLLICLTCATSHGQTASAPTPRSEDEFTARYGDTDSNRVLITYWFHSRNAARKGVLASLTTCGIGLIGFVATGSNVQGSSSAIAGTGAGLAIVSTLLLTYCTALGASHSNRQLYQVLERRRMLPAYRWRKAFMHRQREFVIKTKGRVPGEKQ